MSNYRTVPLGTLCNVRIGRTPRRSERRYWGGRHPWATVRDLDGGTLVTTQQGITDAALEEVMPQPVEPDTLLFSFKLSIGKLAFAGRAMHHNEAIAALTVRDPTILDREFLFHALKATTHDDAANHAVLGKVLNKRKVEELEVPLPPLDEQRRIVRILNRVTHIERLRTQAADRLREFIPALFIKMFGDPITNPLGWKIGTLGDVCISTQYGTSKKASDHAEGVPVLRMGNVTYDGYLDCEDMKYAEFTNREFDKYALREGDILFNRTNSKDLVGKTGIWDGRFEAVPASYFIRLRVKETVVDPVYVWALMNSSATKHWFFNTARGAIGQANINSQEVKSLPLPVPPIALQRRYAKIVETAQAPSKLAESGLGVVSALTASLAFRLLGDHA